MKRNHKIKTGQLRQSDVRFLVSTATETDLEKLKLYALVTVIESEPGSLAVVISSNLPVYSKALQALLADAAARMRIGRRNEKISKIRAYYRNRLRHARLPGYSGYN
jgi:hypothetical protein